MCAHLSSSNGVVSPPFPWQVLSTKIHLSQDRSKEQLKHDVMIFVVHQHAVRMHELVEKNEV